jgi:hypothetical protein
LNRGIILDKFKKPTNTVKVVLRYFSVLLIFLSFLSSVARATHIRAGEILVERTLSSEYTYLIKVIIYSDRTSPVLPGGGTLDLGDGTIITNLYEDSESEVYFLDNEVAKNIFTITHSYTNSQPQYTIGYQEVNRNGGILNMSNSVNTPFYIETAFLIVTPCDINNTPTLLIPPLDYAATGKIFVHNAGAYDKEGDSLTYKFVVPKQSATELVNDYIFPDNISLNEISGEIIWQVPNITGEYNIAFEIIEWRIVSDSAVLLSTTTRDMQIIVVDNLSNPPEVITLKDTCIVAGDFISERISVNDLNEDQVKLESYSQVFLFDDSPAYMVPGGIYYDDVPFYQDFNWQTTGIHISPIPYKVHFKATDDSPTNIPLTDIKTWRIKVSAPPPQNIVAELQENGTIRFNWDSYDYGADKIQIRRRIASYEIQSGSCITGIPEYSWYELVAETSGNEVEYIDQHPNGRFNRGANYCYRLLAKIPGCNETESASSEDICIQIPVDAPVITNVSVLQTDQEEGEVYIRWTSSFDIDTTIHNPLLFSYGIKRIVNDEYGNAVIITPDNYIDTIFVDAGINTEHDVLRYIVYLYEDGIQIDSSAVASTVRLSGDPVIDHIGLQWEADVPWSNNTQSYPYHHIYRDNTSINNPDILLLMDSVNVNYEGYYYIDSTIALETSIDGEYCYFIETYGSYGNPKISEPLINRSQIYCAYKHDTIPPCTPQLVIENSSTEECRQFLSDKPCDFNGFYNQLIIKECEDIDIIGYNIYNTADYDDSLTFFAFTESTRYLHDNLPSFIGCYAVSAISFSGLESEISPVVCNDNCPYFELPNVFTPNEDGYNDQFTEYNTGSSLSIATNKCPRFVKRVEFSVYNRYGLPVYHSESVDPEVCWIEWNGIYDNGQKVSTGIYFYQAIVTYDVLDPANESDNINGWISVLY